MQKTCLDVSFFTHFFQNEPSTVGSAASNMRLLSTSWMNAEAGTSGRGDFVASTIDVDAIKVSFSCGVES